MKTIIKSINMLLAGLPLLFVFSAVAQRVETIPYGDMDRWVTRHVKESRIIGGHEKKCYSVGPVREIFSSEPCPNPGGSPWATSNVVAKVMGIKKVSNAVYPDARGAGKCAKLTTEIDNCKAVGIIDINVLVAGTLFLGTMEEPIKSTKSPYSKMDMGWPYTKRPGALQFDYKLVVPAEGGRVYSSGFGKSKTMPGTDRAEVFILLQRRWEDSAGKLHAKRVGTGRELLARSTNGWVNRHQLDVHYGDITGKPFYRSNMGLIPTEKSYYSRNSRGELVPVHEEGWDDASATPTHMLVMFSAGSGEPYVGTPGLTLWVDNVGLVFGPGNETVAMSDEQSYVGNVDISE